MNVYLMCGLAFAGKTTLASAIQQHTGAVLISLDELNLERGLRGGLGIPVEEWKRSHSQALLLLERALEEGKDAIVDDTNCFRFLRDSYRSVAEGFGASTYVILVKAPVDLVVERLRANLLSPGRAIVREEVLADLINKFEFPMEDETMVQYCAGEEIQTWIRHLPVSR